jgi:23S rRNA (adenine2030-N6)-methyltransferase
MLSYRHAFHAGNAADVFKHCVLVHCLDHLRRKEKPFLVADAHAGAGLYALETGYAAQNREWEGGIGRLRRPEKVSPEALPPLVGRYLEAASFCLTGAADKGSPGAYPGSPSLIHSFLREQDRGVFFELHPTDFALLEEQFKGKKGITLRKEDSFTGLKGLLPPPERRACVFMDPSYELEEDYPGVKTALEEALRRFSTGLYITWYPLLAGTGKGGADFADSLTALYGGNRCRVELRHGYERQRGLCGSGLIIYNPPWTLKAALEEGMDMLAELFTPNRSMWELEWNAA